MADEEDDLWAQIYGEEAPPEEKLAAPAAPAAVPLPQQQREFASAPEHDGTYVKQQENDMEGNVKAEASAFGAEAEDNDELDIQLDEDDASDEDDDNLDIQPAEDECDDDEFDIQLDDDSPAEALEAQAAPAQAESKAQQPDKQQQQSAQHMVSGPHRYVRPGLEQPSLASSGPGLPSPGLPKPAYNALEGDEPSLIPGVAAPSAVQQPAGPAGPPKKWPHTFNYNVPPQGVGEGEPVLPSEAGPGQRIRLPGQTKVTTEEYKEFLGLGHGDIFDLDPDMVADAPWRMPANLEDMKAFFNYDMNLHKWREYCKRVEQYRLQYTMQHKIQTLDSSAAGPPPEIDPDLPEELRAALAAERGQSIAQHHRPLNTFPQGGPRPPPRPSFQPRQNQSSDAIVLLGDDSAHNDLNGASDTPKVTPRQNGGQGVKINLSSSEAGKKVEAPKEAKAMDNGSSTVATNGIAQPKPPPGKPPPPRAPSGGPPPRPSRGVPRPPPPRPPSGPYPNGPGMMSMGAHGVPFGQMGMMGMGGPMMGHPMMGNGPPMMHLGMGMGGPMGMGMQGGPRMMGDFYGPMMGGPMGGPMGPGAPPMPPMMRDMYNGNMNEGGWGRGRGTSLAELGITEEEFEEYAQRKPRRDRDGENPEAGALAMGMDVDPSQAPKQGSKSHTDGLRHEEASSDEDRDRNRRRDKDRDSHRSRDSDRPRSSRHRRSHSPRTRSRSRERSHSRRHR